MGVLAARGCKAPYVCGLLPRATRQHVQAKEKAQVGAWAEVEAGVGTLHTNHKYVLYKFVLVNMNRIALAARQQAPRQRATGSGGRGQLVSLVVRRCKTLCGLHQ